MTFVHQPAEPYLTTAELAAAMRVSVPTIKRWRKLGMPSETWGLGNTRRYLLSECMAWARARGHSTLGVQPAPRMTPARPQLMRE